MIQTDLIIIGAGPGGYDCAARAAEAGLHTVIIEKKALGGTCLNEGCIPTKCFCRSAEVLDEVRTAATYGLKAEGSGEADMELVVARKDGIVAQLVAGIRTMLKHPLISIVEGEACFTDSHTIAVGEETYTAPSIIIATGSATKFLPIEGAHAEGVVTSTEMLKLTALPRRLCIIGGGVIGLEFASVFHTFGSEVTVVEFCPEILPRFDREVAKRLRMALKKSGITFQTNTAVKAVRPVEGGWQVVCDGKDGPGSYVTEADLVLMAVGRTPYVEGLGLDVAGVDVTPRGITVDENMQTNVPGVYAVGDVNGLSQLAHVATYQSYRALNHILGRADDINLRVVPAAVFTRPELATVGITEEEAKSQGMAYTAHKSFYRANGKALAIGETEGLVKLLTDASGRIVGAHILGPHAADMIHEVAIALQHGLTLAQLRDTIHAHPTLSELLAGVRP